MASFAQEQGPSPPLCKSTPLPDIETKSWAHILSKSKERVRGLHWDEHGQLHR